VTSNGGFELTIPDAMWQDVRGDRTLLKSVLWLNGCPLHVEAVAVQAEEDGLLSAACQEDGDRLEALEEMYAACWQTVEIGSEGCAGETRAYVIYAVPFER